MEKNGKTYIEGICFGPVETICGAQVSCSFISKRASRALLAGHFGKRHTIKAATLVWELGLSSLYYFLRQGFIPTCESETCYFEDQEKIKTIFFIKLPPLPDFAFSKFILGAEDLLEILPYLERKI